MGTIQSIILVRPLLKPWTPQLSLGTIQCIYLVWSLLNSLESLMGTIQSIILVRHPSKTLDSPSLSGNNTLHTFSQTSVENTRPPTPTGYNTVHTFGQTPVEILYSPTFTGYNTGHTFSQNPVENSRLPNSNWVQYTAHF